MSGRGQALVEFAMITPVLLLVVSGVADVGRAFYFTVATENTAREAAHWAALTDASGYPLDDNAIFQKVAQPSQESFGIRLGLPPQCTNGGTYVDGAPVGTCSAGSSVLRYAQPPVQTTMASPVGGPSLGSSQSWMFIYPGKSGRTAMTRPPLDVAWSVTDVRSYVVAAPNSARSTVDWPGNISGAFGPTAADAASSVDCYGFGAPTGLTTWNASLDPANSASLTQTESPGVAITATGNPPANDLTLSVSNTSPSLSGSLTQNWTPSGSNTASAFLSTTTGQTAWAPTGTFSIGAHPPPPGSYTITVTVSAQNKPSSLSATCTQIDQSSTFTLKVFGDPCKTGYTNPGGNPFSTTCTKPIVASVTASSGSFVGGYNVTITGSNFDKAGNGNCSPAGNPASVIFGTIPGTVVSCNSSTMVATVPSAPPSTVDVIVTDTNNNSSVVNAPADTFTYVCAAASKPCISSVTPRNGKKQGGDSITIMGANFFTTGASPICQVTGVTIGGAAAAMTSCTSDSTLTVTTPAGSPGTVDVVVTTSGCACSSGTSSADAFTYLNDPPALPPASPGGTVHQITVTVIYAFVPITPGLGLLGQTAVYIVGEATIKATY